jgi:hypothetical protein
MFGLSVRTSGSKETPFDEYVNQNSSFGLRFVDWVRSIANVRTRNKRWIAVVALVAALLLLFFLTRKTVPASEAVEIRAVGRTNAPGSDRPFTLFAVKNRAEYDIRWRGDWVEVEGDQNQRARLMNLNLPGAKYAPLLKSGEGFLIAVGDPLEEARWRLTMSFVRYGFKEKWIDFSVKHQLPLRIGRLVLASPEDSMNPSNRVMASTAWIGGAGGLK